MSSSADGAPGLYIHVPFCAAICPYCDFAVTVGGPAKRRRFVAAVAAEAALFAASAEPWREPFDTVYVGGGTPSDLEIELASELLATLSSRLEIAAKPRLFFEANPEDVRPSALLAWRELGVTTLSLGVQSFDDRRLRFLGRAHDGAGAARAVREARTAGFETVSVDLIFGLPDDDVTSWRADLERAIELGVDHVSCYQLTIHRRTAFGARARRGELAELGEGPQAELFELTHRRLSEAGFDGYEISNFARGTGHRSAHNLKYWRHVPYLGLGPSAHSFDGRRRWWNRRSLSHYESSLARRERPLEALEELTTEQLVLERLMLGLRLREGVDLAKLEERYGVALVEPNRGRIEELAARRLVVAEGAHVRPTTAGMAVADGLVRHLEVG